MRREEAGEGEAVLKVLLVHPGVSFSVSDVFDGLVGGLRANGAEVGIVNLADSLSFYDNAHVKKDDEWVKAFPPEASIAMAAKAVEVYCYEWWPDVVVVVSGWFIPPEVWGVLARRPHHTVLWCTESPYEDDRQARPARYVDTVILNDPTNLDTFRADTNPRTFYLPHSYDPDRHKPGRATVRLRSDFAFVGTGWASRIEFFEQVDWAGVDVVLGGAWQHLPITSPLAPFLLHERSACLDNADAVNVYRSAKVNANLYRKETSEHGTADGWAMGPREVELAACGAFFLREPRGEGDELLSMLPTFTTPGEFGDQLRWWLAHPAQRKTAAAAARAAIADRTFTNTAASLLRLVDGHTKAVR